MKDIERNRRTCLLLHCRDCPFFVENEAASVSGRGEGLASIELDLDDYHIKLVNPGIHISTAEAFSGISYSNNVLSVNWTDISSWKESVLNDFEGGAFEKHTSIREIKDGQLCRRRIRSERTMFDQFFS